MTKVSVHLNDADLATLKEIADERETTFAQVLRQALQTERYVTQEVRTGARVLIERGDKVRELVFR